MKTLGKVILVSAFCAGASPAFACDMHGGGMFWMPSHQWQNFSPKIDPLDEDFLGGEEDDFLGQDIPTFEAPPEPRKMRPSFSSAATKASRAAKTRVMMMAKSDIEIDAEIVPESEGADEEPIIKTGLKSNAQSVR